MSSMQILPRYFSFKESYKNIEKSIEDKNENEWKKGLVYFAFPEDCKEIIVKP